MNESVESPVLERLSFIREDIGGLKGDFDAFKQEVRTEYSNVRSDLRGQHTMLFGLATVIGQIDQRVERLEQKLGGGE